MEIEEEKSEAAHQQETAAEIGESFTDQEIEQLWRQYGPQQVAKQAGETTEGIFNRLLNVVYEKWDELSSETQKEMEALARADTGNASTTPKEVVFGSKLIAILTASTAITTSSPEFAVIGGAISAGGCAGALGMLKHLKQKYEEAIDNMTG